MKTKALTACAFACIGKRVSLPQRSSRMAALALVLLFGRSIGWADSADVTEYLTLGQKACTGEALGVYADVEQDGTWGTFVVFNTVAGQANAGTPGTPGTGAKDYLYTPNNCSGSSGTGRFWIRFVNRLAPGFVPTDPDTWIYKSVGSVRLVVTTSGQDCVTPDGTGYFAVWAYTNVNQGGLAGGLAGSYTYSNHVQLPPQTLEFTSPAGIKEIYLRSDDCENSVASLVLLATARVDAGLRAYDGTAVVKLASEPPGQQTSPIRINKNGTTYGLLLTDVNSPDASKFRVQTSSGVKALMKLP
jgi:hypothetical protein